MAAKPQNICSRPGCSGPMEFRDVNTDAPLCVKHVAVVVSMRDSEFSAGEGGMVFMRYAELLGAATDPTIVLGARDAVLEKLRDTATDFGVWILTKLPSPTSATIPAYNDLSQEMIAAVSGVTRAIVNLAQARQTSLQQGAWQDYLEAANRVWAVVVKAMGMANPARSRALETARPSYTRAVVALAKKIIGQADQYEDSATLARQAGVDLDAAFQ